MKAAETPEPLKESCNASASTATDDDDGFVRLHISPFDADLLKIVVPASALSSARNISFHIIETFPERRFGFIDLPRLEAEKMKKKLNGTVLKGAKVRIDRARPETRIEPAAAQSDADKTSTGKDVDNHGDDGGAKKRKRETTGVVGGVRLSDRKVKRGWTEPAEHKSKRKGKDDGSRHVEKLERDHKRKQPRSRYIEKEECLLKVRVPPNEMRNLPEDDASATSKKKRKKNKDSSRQVTTVHEFEKTTKFMSFLRSSAPAADQVQATDYVDGKGWVDELGNLVEGVADKKPSKPQPPPQPEKTKQVAKPSVRLDMESDDSASESDDTSSDDTSSAESSSDDESEEEPVDDKVKTQTPPDITEGKERSGHSKSLTIEIPPPPPPPPPATPKAMHPLEALYKRTRQDGGQSAADGAAEKKKEGFSFFGPGDGQNDEDEDDRVESGGVAAAPMTPFTKQDFDWRRVRSAAPTPDTVHPAARMSSFFQAAAAAADDDVDKLAAGREDVVEEEDEDEDEDEDDDDGEGSARAAAQLGTSDFQQWFWENRRDLNRSWMTRRKTATKEKRYRDNKARASKAV